MSDTTGKNYGAQEATLAAMETVIEPSLAVYGMLGRFCDMLEAVPETTMEVNGALKKLYRTLDEIYMTTEADPVTTGKVYVDLEGFVVMEAIGALEQIRVTLEAVGVILPEVVTRGRTTS